jgi:recombinational DNA repair ATPase RecF
VKLANVHVTRYRSAEDSGPFTIEPDVTCLVGKNESGKTNILQACSESVRHPRLRPWTRSSTTRPG